MEKPSRVSKSWGLDKSNDRGGSIEQVMAGVFNYFGFPIPKDDTFGSGLNIDLMIDYLVNEEDYIV